MKFPFLPIVLAFLSPLILAANVVEVAGYRFIAPDGWKQSEPSSSMRKAQFELSTEDGKTAELVFFYFGPSGGGGVRANVDRWLKQFEDLQDQDVKEEIVQEVKVTYARATGTFLSGSPFGPKTPKPGYSLLGAIVEGRQGSVFLKMVGQTQAVHAFEKPVIEMIEKSLTK
jgi:hypothetical protein